MNNEQRKLAHAIQSGVAYDPDQTSLEGKHLRVGINMAMVEHDALVHLLMLKGIITYDEYSEQLTAALQREVDRYQKYLAEKLGAEVVLK